MHLIYLNILFEVIIQRYFNDSTCILHYYDDMGNSTRPVHLKNVPVIGRQILGIANLLLDKHLRCRHFLLQCEDARNAFESTEFVINHETSGMYNNRKYIIIVNDEESFEDFFNSSSLTFVRDLLVIYADKLDENDNLTEIKLFTHKYIGLEEYNNPVLLDIWYTENFTFKFDNNLFPDKITNQQGRELRAPCFTLIPFAWCYSIDEPIGNEHNIVIKYAQRYNFTLNIHLNDSLEDYGYYDEENGTGGGAIFSLFQENEEYSDMVYGGFPSRQTDGVKTVIYTYVVSVPLPTVKHGWLMFLEVFDLYTWLASLFLFMLTRGIVYLRSRLRLKFTKSQISNITLFGLLINQPTTFSTHVKKSRFLKSLVMLMLVTNVLLVTAYSSRLSSVMVKPMLENNINTLSELAASNLQLLFFDYYYWPLKTDERPIYRKLYEKIVVISNRSDYELSRTLLSSREYAVARYRRINGDYFEDEEYLQQMQGKYKPITPELFTNYYYILLRKNSMHTYQLQELVRTAEEAGLMRFWEEDALRFKSDMLFQKQMQEFTIDNNNVILNMLHLKGIFAFWGFGMIISFMFFIKELLKKRKNIK